MKTITLAVLVSIVLVAGLALASQSGEQKDHTSMMQEMMKGEKGMEGMSGMGGMMRMMKMMDQCGAMMESTDGHGEKAKESQNK
jgi:hypothetical protein